MTDGAKRAAETAARESYGRLLAMLASRSRDVVLAEDALADAFASALASWPDRGVPDNPDAWLMTAARRNIGHARARMMTAKAADSTLLLLAEERAGETPAAYRDDRLKLMFVCTHPAIDPAIQAPLILQTVLGLDAARIAASFLVSPATMGQKLVRAKAKIRDAGISFDIPEASKIGGRITAVLEAIYAAYGTGWEDVFGEGAKTRGLSEEAIWLGRLVVGLLPDRPESLGLLSLMLHCEARRSARRDSAGSFVPLRDQNPQRWRRDMVAEAEVLLREAARFAVAGRFQIEAAIQSLHAQSILTGEPNVTALMALYDLLVSIAPTIGASVARACAYAEGGEAVAALAQLDALARRAPSYQPLWAARARTLFLLRRFDEADAAAKFAAGLSSDPAVRDYLLSGGLFAKVRPSLVDPK